MEITSDEILDVSVDICRVIFLCSYLKVNIPLLLFGPILLIYNDDYVYKVVDDYDYNNDDL